MKLRIRSWPRSLVGRVFALYTLALAGFVCAGLALFYRYQFGVELENAQVRAEAIVAVVAPTVADNAVIGDYDTIRRTLEHAIVHSDYAAAVFIDIRGAVVKAERHEAPEVAPPAWLERLMAQRLYDTNKPIVVGGRDYGVVRLQFAPERIAGGVWRQARAAVVLALATFAGGLLLLWMPLHRWLGGLGHIRSISEGMRAGTPHAATRLSEDAPIELQRTVDVLNRTAANLQVQREQADATLGAIADGVFTLDLQRHVVLANPAACAVLGMDVFDVIGRPMGELMPELFGDGMRCRPWRDRRASIETAGGRRRVVETTLSSITGADAQVYGHVLACRDVSVQHALDLRLQEEQRARTAAITSLRSVLEGLMPQGAGPRGGHGDVEAISQMIAQLVRRMHEHSERLNAIVALSPDGFVSFDASHTANYVSPGFMRLTGLDESEVLGLDELQFAAQMRAGCGEGAMPPFGTLREADAEAARRPDRRVLVHVERPTRRTLEATLRPADGAVISQVLHLRDVTHEVEVDQMKSEFLSTAAHELRTPMASIFGFTELMMHRPMSAERQKEVIATVHRQTALMISIVNELLDLARIEARRGKDFKIETVDLCALVVQAVRDFKPPDERPLPELALPAGAVHVRADRSKFTQAFGNVLSNAYKYSPAGGAVSVGLCVERAAAGEGRRVGLRVSDQGIGMTPEQAARVSERFYRADNSGTIAGTGLGMSIVKEIVELHGGALELSSAPAKGTIVTLWLPLPVSDFAVTSSAALTDR